MGRFNRGVSTSIIRIISDIMTFLLSFIVCSFLVGIDVWEWRYVSFCVVLTVIYILAGNGYKLYLVSTFQYTDRVIRLVTKSYIIAAGILAILMYAVGNISIDNRFFIVYLLLTYVLIIMNGILFKKFTKRLHMFVAPRTLLIGEKQHFDKFHRYVNQSNFQIKEIGYVSLSDEYSSEEYLGSYKDIENIVHTYVIDQVYFLQSDSDDLKEKIRVLMDMGVTAKVLLHCNNLEGIHTYVSSCGTYPVITYHTVSLNKYAKCMKRIMDIVGSLAGIIISSPFMLVVAIAIKCSSKGPVIFKQERVGLNGRRFMMYKFRSMFIDAEERKKELLKMNQLSSNHMFKMENDPRITKVGKVIRKLSLDELPQFFNILAGHMSLVGTRPPTVNEVEYYERKHWKRMSIKPGLTGMWQTSGRNSITDFEEIVDLDIRYIHTWSISLDIKILFKTVLILLKPSGAY